MTLPLPPFFLLSAVLLHRDNFLPLKNFGARTLSRTEVLLNFPLSLAPDTAYQRHAAHLFSTTTITTRLNAHILFCPGLLHRSANVCPCEAKVSCISIKVIPSSVISELDMAVGGREGLQITRVVGAIVKFYFSTPP
jgi:hypothetical protein